MFYSVSQVTKILMWLLTSSSDKPHQNTRYSTIVLTNVMKHMILNQSSVEAHWNAEGVGGRGTWSGRGEVNGGEGRAVGKVEL